MACWHDRLQQTGVYLRGPRVGLLEVWDDPIADERAQCLHTWVCQQALGVVVHAPAHVRLMAIGWQGGVSKGSAGGQQVVSSLYI
eukprot:8656767-Pyramimonas_sp.AAC.2